MREEIKELIQLPGDNVTLGNYVAAGSTAALGQQAAASALTGLSANSVFGAYRGSNFTSTDNTSIDNTTNWLNNILAYVQTTNHKFVLNDALGDAFASFDQEGAYLSSEGNYKWESVDLTTGKTSPVSVDKGAELDRMAKIAKANTNPGVTPGIRMVSFALRPEVATNLSAPDRDLSGPQESRPKIIHVASAELRDERGILIGTVSAISNTAIC